MAFNATTVRYIRHQLEHSDKKNHCIFDWAITMRCSQKGRD
jgi:hypothetical protein